MIQNWDDTTGIYTAYTDDGVLILQRKYNEAESNTLNARIMDGLQVANRNTIESALSDALVEVQTIIDATNQQINSSPAAYIKILARAARRIIRLLIRRFDGTT